MGEAAKAVVLGAVVERADGAARVLITRRRARDVYGGLWELPGGKVEAGETLHEALQRELGEELGISVKVGRALPVITHDGDGGRVRLHPFYCAREDARPPEARAAAEWRWVSAEALATYPFPPANVTITHRIAQDLAESSG
jgi:mutator protein MutT